MKRKIKSKLILCIIIVNLALTGIIRNELSVKYVDDSRYAKDDVISDIRGAAGYWEPPITKFAGLSPYNAFIGDANNDGYNDISISNFDSDDISIFLWNSTSDDWDPQITKSVGNAPTSVFIGDANNDGYNDITTSNEQSNNVSIFLWNSTSVDWDPQITKSVGNEPHGVFIGDANNDGYNDIAAANQFSDNVSIFLWNSTSVNWDPQITRTCGLKPLGIFIEDANNDGYNDITTANFDSDDISIILWNSTSGDWDPQITKSVGDEPIGIFIGDANNDGYNDIAISNFGFDNISIILWNSTSGDWDPQITKSVGDDPHSIFIGDANNDGYNDIATANAISNNISILLWNSTSGGWDPQITKSVGNNPRSVIIGDANNDGYNDIATANYESDDLSIILWKQPSISIISPENKVYGPLEGYYPATYGFDNELDWTIGLSLDFLDEYFGVGPASFVEILTIDGPIDGHNKVLRVRDAQDSTNTWGVHHFDNPPNVGTIEFYVYVIGTAGTHHLALRATDDTVAFEMRVDIGAGKFQYFDGASWQSVSNALAGMWVHHSISFDCEAGINGQFTWIISYENGTEIGRVENIEFQNDLDTLDELYLGSTIAAYLIMTYWDAFGFSWDPGYNIGDNLNEGMQLSFYNNTYLDWIAYSLDGQANISIFGQEIIPLPADGPHTIQLFGRDNVSGDIIESEIRDFIVDTTTPVININSPSPNQLCGVTAPFFDVQIIELNLHEKGYSFNGGQNITFTTETQFNQTEWDKIGNGTVLIRFYAIDELGNINFTEVVVRKDAYVPDITIHSPLDDQKFGKAPPDFNLTIIEEDLASTWYTIEGIAGTFPFTELTGTINQDAWDDAPEGEITITFYALDGAGNIGNESVIVIKKIPSEPVIPGYNLFFLLSILSFVAILIRKKLKKS